MSDIRLHNLKQIDDPVLLPFLDLYESAFPQRERRPVSELLTVLHAITGGYPPAKRLCAAFADGVFAGLMIYDLARDLDATEAFLEFFAVVPALRGAGLGRQLLHLLRTEIVREAGAAFVLVLEMEDPASFPHGSEEEAFAVRRIGFYRRAGARILVQGVQYELTMPHWPEPTPLLLAFLPLTSQTLPVAKDCLAAARRLLPAERFRLTGDALRLE